MNDGRKIYSNKTKLGLMVFYSKESANTPIKIGKKQKGITFLILFRVPRFLSWLLFDFKNSAHVTKSDTGS